MALSPKYQRTSLHSAGASGGASFAREDTPIASTAMIFRLRTLLTKKVRDAASYATSSVTRSSCGKSIACSAREMGGEPSRRVRVELGERVAHIAEHRVDVRNLEEEPRAARAIVEIEEPRAIGREVFREISGTRGLAKVRPRR
jgi:hypothetical protein